MPITNLIKNPQIFVIYEPGMFGSFLCSLLIDHPLYNSQRLDKNISTAVDDITAHTFGYLDIIKNFHDHDDITNLLKKDSNALHKFFQPLATHGLGVNRLVTYHSIKINLQDHFKNFIRIIVRPKKNRIHDYAKRMTVTVKPDHTAQYWARHFSKKNWADVPKWWIDAMVLKECEKYIGAHTDFLDSTHAFDPKRDIMFDPDNITNKTALEKMISTACDMLEIENFNPSFKNLKHFAQKNKKFL